MTRTRATANGEGDIYRTDRGEQGMKREVFKECGGRRARSCEAVGRGVLKTCRHGRTKIMQCAVCRGGSMREDGDGGGDGAGG